MENQSVFCKELKNKLDSIASEYKGEYCHIVAEEMQDAFKKYGLESKVWEIYTNADKENGNHIMIMGCRVRNHYINDLYGIVFDSSTGSKGKIWDTYISEIQKDNPKHELEFKIVG